MVHRVALDARRVLLGIDAHDRETLLRRMATAVLTAPGISPDLSADSIVDAILAREGEHTSVVDGVALPHTRLAGVNGPRICIATVNQPIDWSGHPVRLVVLMLGPPKRPGALLQIMGRVARLLADPEARRHLEQARDAKALAQWLEDNVREEDAPILAEEIMRPAIGLIPPDMPVAELVQRMAERNLDAAGVTDENRILLGQVTADDLFTLGVPDFFRQLKSVSFIAEFDPFEKYFDREQGLLVRHVMTQNYCSVPPDATALEVVFQLSVKHFPKVFVVDKAGRLLGVIDRIRVLDRIFNL